MTSIFPHLDDVPPLKILKLDTDPIAVSAILHEAQDISIEKKMLIE